jgi:uncharacterized membrane protein
LTQGLEPGVNLDATDRSDACFISRPSLREVPRQLAGEGQVALHEKHKHAAPLAVRAVPSHCRCMTLTDAPPAPRLGSIDLARSLAIVAMVIYHFTFDLALFGFIARDTMFQPFWYYSARLIAGSFLFLMGISLWLAHGQGIRWPAFWKRWAKLAAAALLVTIASIWLVPVGPIWFGILHAMAVIALIGLIALRLPWPVTLALAAVFFAAAWGPRFAALDPLWLVWIGLAETRPMMGDYIPLIPWTAPALAGIATAKALRLDLWRGTPPTPLTRAIAFPSRHSLLIYLLQQPVLFGLISAYIWVSG